MKVYGEYIEEIENVNEFIYLGIKLVNNSSKPEELLNDRIKLAKRTFNAVRTNCRLLGISNVRVKL